ncbi:hypothetical protein LKV13_01050 [Borrelia sp. BU AG58]|uniref:hypothetical protein n=1 Tax=Borrelia sp. BU AG58 TaxID=2887345 RepID=UPI001E4FD107|nr:hypothetical protein [Borrelia sp. BU AG58]UER67406.1 hypothetical protein LKV13_01050 [Borrelia sp. BU AG58]
MLKNLKSQIQKRNLERDKKLAELGKTLKNSNTIEIKQLASYTSLKLIEKELTQLKANLDKAEENENRLRELYKNLTNCKETQKNTLKAYKIKLKRTVEALINNYPKNLEPILEYKMNYTKSILEKDEYKMTEIASPNEKPNFFKKIIENIALVAKNILGRIHVRKIAKEFEKKILREHLSSENLENLVNEFIENEELSRELIEEIKLMNEARTNAATINDTIRKTKNKSIKCNINNKNKIESRINVAETNKENILKKIAEEFIKMAKVEKGLSKAGATGPLLKQIESLDQQILELNKELEKTIKIDEIATIKAKMQQLVEDKKSIENKLNKLNSKVETIQNEIDELDNK